MNTLRVAVIGASGTGKTSIIERIKQERQGWTFVTEATRRLVPILGYESPWQFVSNYGIAFYESIMLAQWEFLNYLSPGTVVSDRSPLDNYIYYLLVRQPTDERYEKPLEALCRHYLGFFDLLLRVPPGVFPFQKDEMRMIDLQNEFDEILWRLIGKWALSVETIQTSSIESRSFEAIGIIESRHLLVTRKA